MVSVDSWDEVCGRGWRAWYGDGKRGKEMVCVGMECVAIWGGGWARLRRARGHSGERRGTQRRDYTAGFIAPVMGDTYLKQHDAPEDVEYYLCGPPMMAKTVLDLLHSLGVDDADLRFDKFGG